MQTDVIEMKETEPEKLPEDWSIKKIGDFFEVNYGKSRPKTEGLIPVVGSSGIYATSDKALVTDPTIIVGRKGNAGEAYLFKEPCYPSDTTFYLSYKDEILKELNIDFVYRYLTFNSLSGEHAKTTIPSLKKGDLVNYSFPLPQLIEQQKIVSILSTVQNAIEQTEAVIQATRELKKSMMKHLFTYGPVPVDQTDKVELKETEIGFINDELTIEEIDTFGKIITGTTPSTKKKEFYEGGGYQFIAPADLGKTTKIFSSEKELSELGKENARPLPVNTPLFVCIGSTIGKVGITVEENACTNQQINAIRPNERFNSFYLCYLLDYFSTHISKFATRSPVPIISKGKFSDVEIPFISDLDKQKNIALSLKTVDTKIAYEMDKKTAYKTLFNSLLENLMTAKIRVG